MKSGDPVFERTVVKNVSSSAAEVLHAALAMPPSHPVLVMPPSPLDSTRKKTL